MKSVIIKKDGYVYEKVGSKKGFETWFNVGKDPDDPRWKPKGEEIEVSPKKKTKKTVVDTEIVENVNEKEPVE